MPQPGRTCWENVLRIAAASQHAHQVICVGPCEIKRLARVFRFVGGLHNKSGPTPGDEILDEAVIGAAAFCGGIARRIGPCAASLHQHIHTSRAAHLHNELWIASLKNPFLKGHAHDPGSNLAAVIGHAWGQSCGGGLPRLVDGAGAAAACSICLSWL